MFSLEQSLAVRGGVALADRLERIAYNALPATLSADMWSHQYDQQANQVLCSLNRRRWVSNGPESNLFGLEPNFGCCTANLHQGWPKLVASLWMASPDDGLAAVAYGPSKVQRARRARRAGDDRGTHRLSVPRRDRARRPAAGLAAHLPAAPAHSAMDDITDDSRERRAACRTSLPAGSRGSNVPGEPAIAITIQLPMTPATSTWYRDSIAVERGPLVFSLPVGEDWRRVTTGHEEAGDRRRRRIGKCTRQPPGTTGSSSIPARRRACIVDEGSVGAVPFAAGGAGGHDPRDRAARAGMAAGGRIGGNAAAEPRDQPRARRDAAAGPVRIGATARDRVSADRSVGARAKARADVTRAYVRSDVARLHLLHQVVARADGQRHDGQRRVLAATGHEARPVRDEEILDVVCLAELGSTPTSSNRCPCAPCLSRGSRSRARDPAPGMAGCSSRPPPPAFRPRSPPLRE